MKRLTTTTLALALCLGGCSAIPFSYLDKAERIQRKVQRVTDKLNRLNNRLQGLDVQATRACLDKAGIDLAAAEACFAQLGGE